MKRLSLLFLVLTLLVPGMARAVNYPSNSEMITNRWLPIKVGERLDYRGYGYYAGSSRYYEGLAEEVVSGVNCIKLLTVEDGDTMYFWFAQDVDGNIRMLRMGSTTYSKNNAPVYMPADPQVGDTVWDMGVISGTVIETGVTVDDLSTGMGPYLNCIRVLLEYFDDVDHYIIAPEIGLIKEEREDNEFEDPRGFEMSGHTAHKVYYPHVANDLDWDTDIALINASSLQNLIGSFFAYNADGEEVWIGPPEIIAPSGRYEFIVAEEIAVSEPVRYIVFEGNHTRTAEYMKFYVDGRYRAAMPAVPESDINTGEIHVSHIASTDIWETEISLVNTNTASRTVTIDFDDGRSVERILAAGGCQNFKVADLFGGTTQSTITSATVGNASGVIGVELFSGDTQKILSGILLKDDVTDRITFPHVAVNNGWGTGIVAYNPSSEDAELTITPYDTAGTALNAADVTVAAGKKYVGTVTLLGLPVDTAWIDIASDRDITGFELFTKPGQMGGYTGVEISGKTGIFPKLDREGGAATGIAFVNLSAQFASVNLTAYDDDGIVVATATVTLGGFQKQVDLSGNLFSEDISAATYITYDSDQELVGFQLNVSGDGTMLDGLPAN